MVRGYRRDYRCRASGAPRRHHIPAVATISAACGWRMLGGNRNSRGAGPMVLRNDTISTAEKELMALHEREEKLKELLEAARREHNEAVADRHRAADSDEAALTGINMQIVALCAKFDRSEEHTSE